MVSKYEYIGVVVDNNDPEKKGRCKVRIPVLHWGLGDEDLPFLWPAIPFSSVIPEIGEKYLCYFTDKFFDWGFYAVPLKMGELTEDKYFEDSVKSSIGSSSEYPNMKFIKGKNGILVGYDSSEDNPEVVIYHPSGSYIFINKDGKFDIKTSQKSVKELFTDLFSKIAAIQTVGSPTNHTLDPASILEFNTTLPLELDKIFL